MGYQTKARSQVGIPDLHKDTESEIQLQLHKKASNAILRIGIVFYDNLINFGTNKENQVVRKETYSLPIPGKNVEGKMGQFWRGHAGQKFLLKIKHQGHMQADQISSS